MQPSSQPSGSPTAQPTSQPSGQPTVEPSGQPTAQPTSDPSAQPTAVPTSQPSGQPSTQPSCQPTSQPTAHPSTSNPTSAPSSSPSKYPTTSSPTNTGITRPPTSAPTGTPTYGTLDWKNNDIYDNHKRLMQVVNREALQGTTIPFDSFYYKGITPIGACDDWKRYTETKLTLPYDNIFFSEATISSEYHDYATDTTFFEKSTCSDIVQVAKIIESLRSGVSYEFNCDGRSWRVFTCNGERIICLNCKQNCVDTVACPGTNHIVNPCGKPKCSTRAAAAIMVSFSYAFIPLYPEFSGPLQLTPSKYSLDLAVNVTKAGTLYCAAFIAGTSFTSLTKIREAGNFGYMLGTGYVSVHIPNLGPDTTYDVYCYTEDYSSHVMPLEGAIANVARTHTSCCKSITFSMDRPLPRLPEITTALDNPEYSFIISSQPTMPLQVNLVLTSHQCANTQIGTSKNWRLTTVSPAQFNFTGGQAGEKEGKFTVRGYQGCYTIDLIPISRPPNKNITAEVFTADTIEVVIINTIILVPDVPKLTNVKFSNDGQSMYFLFDTNTNAPIFGNATVFRCLNIVDFPGADEPLALCKWIDLKTLKASLAFEGIIKPRLGNDDTARLNEGIIKAQCTSGTCNDYQYAPEIEVSISGPDKAIVPYVSLSSARTVSSCDFITLDPTGSSGHGGRAWQSVRWIVKDGNLVNPNDTRVMPVQTYLNTEYKTGTILSVIPNRILHGMTYSISLELTNFLMQKSTGTVKVSVSSSAATPKLSIAGPAMLIKYRFQPLSLFAVANIPKCAGSVSNMGISYEWKVYRGPTYEDKILSVSADPRYFKLNEFTLEGSTEYTIQVTARGFTETNIDAPIAKYSVLVQIGQSGVSALIKGGQEQTTSNSVSYIIDGSNSFDLDASPSSPSILRYQWSCMIFSPDFGFSCLNFPKGPDAQKSVLQIGKETLPAKTTYSIKLQVINSYNMTSSETIQLKVLENRVPKVTLGAALAKYNRADKMVFTGTVIVESGNAEAYWVATGLIDTTIEDAAETPASYVLRPGTNVVQLSLRPGLFVEGLRYTFSLKAKYTASTSKDQGIAAVTVLINEAPKGGALTITPSSGRALNTTFTWQTAGWSDDPSDYPLAYIFAYYVSRFEDQNVVKSSSELSYAGVTLGQGRSGSGAIVALANATDMYGATGIAFNSKVKVTKLANVDQLSNIAEREMERAFLFKDPSLVSQVITGVTDSINFVECGVPTPCKDLNRKDCSTTYKTCGECLDGYTGVAGDSNVLCGVLPDENVARVRSRRRLEMIEEFGLDYVNSPNVTNQQHVSRRLQAMKVRRTGDICSTVSLKSYCISGVCTVSSPTETIGICAPIQKRCPSDCMEHGDCVFMDINNNPVSVCNMNDIFCRPICHCNGGYVGIDCGVPTADVAVVTELRDSVCRNLLLVKSMQNENEDVIIGRATNIRNTINDYMLVSEDAYEVCVKMLVDTVIDFPVIAGSSRGKAIFVDAFSKVLEKRDLLSERMLRNVTVGLEALSKGIQENMAIGQSPSKIVTNNLRILSALRSPSSLTAEEFTFPRTAYESFDGTPVESVEFDASAYSTSGALGTVVGITVTILANNPTNLISDSSVLTVKTSVYATSNDGTRKLRELGADDDELKNIGTGSFPVTQIATTYKLANPKPVLYKEVPVSNIIVNCYRTRTGPYPEKLRCPTGEIIDMTCPGTKGEFNVTCPSYRDIPQCQSWNSLEFSMNPLCTPVDYTTEHTQCHCSAGDADQVLLDIAAALLAAQNKTNEDTGSSRRLGASYLGFRDYVHDMEAESVVSHPQNIYSAAQFNLISALSQSSPGTSTVEQKFSASMITLRTTFKMVYMSAPPILDAARDFVVLGTLAAIVGVFVFLLYFLLRRDTSELRKARLTKLSDKKMVRTAGDFFGELLPREFEENTWYNHWGHWIKIEHSWFCLFAQYDKYREFRSVKLCVLFSNFLCFVFMSCIMAVLSFGADDGSCENINFAKECLSRKTSWSTRYDCSWLEINSSCGYATPTIDALAFVGYTAVVTLLSLPLSKVLEAMIRSVLRQKDECIRTGESPFWWTIKERAKFGLDKKTGMVVPVNDEGEVDSVAGGSSPAAASPPKAIQVDDESSIGNETFGGKGLAFGPAENEMGEYWEKCDELQDAQTLASKMLRAARLRKLQEYTDYVLPMMEVEMLIALNNHDLKYFGRQLLITEAKNASLEYKSNTVKRARYTMYAKHGKRQVLSRVVQARREMEVLKDELEIIDDDEQREVFIMKHFILDQLSGYRRYLAERFLLGEGRYNSPAKHFTRQFVKYLSILIVPLVWAALIYFIYVYNLSIGSRASTLWLVVTLGSALVDGMFLQPLRIWFRWVAINSAVAKDVRDITKALALRYVSIIQRKAGVMRDANNMIQHFNPACRVARLFPYLPISRFLLSMNDYDIPHFNSNTTPMKNKRGLEYWAALATSFATVFLLMVTALSAPVQDIITETVITLAFNITSVIIYLMSELSPILAGLVTAGLISSVFVREWWHGILKRRHEAKKALKKTEDKYLETALNASGAKSGKPDTYLNDERIDQGIDKTAVFTSKFKPMKGEITERTKLHAAGEGQSLSLHESSAGGGDPYPEASQTVSFGGVNIHDVRSNSGVVVANYDDQAPVPISVKKYGGGGTFGGARNLNILPPLEPRPDGQMRMGSQEVADTIANLERNITENLQKIIKTSIEKSTLHSRRKSARRRQLRANGEEVLEDVPAGARGDAASSGMLSARRRKKKERNDDMEGPGLSARDPMGHTSQTGDKKMLDAGRPSLNFSDRSSAGGGEDEEQEKIEETVPMLGKYASTGPGARLKPVPLGEEFIERKPKVKIKPDVTTQFPDWH